MQNLLDGKNLNDDELELLDKATLKNGILSDFNQRLKILKSLMTYYSESDYTKFKVLTSRYIKDFSFLDENKVFVEFIKLSKGILENQ